MDMYVFLAHLSPYKWIEHTKFIIEHGIVIGHGTTTL